jgi:hypothetical protein
MRATFVRAAAALVVAALAPAGPAQDPPPITKEDLKASRDNLTQIGKAVHAFHEAYRVMPYDLADAEGKPLLSWRVHLLPFLDEKALYQQFKLNEPWDSDHNKKLIGKMPKVYAPVRVEGKEGETFYQGFVGENAPFAPDHPRGRYKLPASFPDGTSNTGLVFEAGESVVWTRPADLPFDAKKPLPKLGGLFDGEFHVLMVDGSVKRIKKDADPAILKLVIMPNDGYVIEFDQIEK